MIILRQKEFGKISNLLRRGGESLNRSAQNLRFIRDHAASAVNSSSKLFEDPELERKLLRRAHNHGARVLKRMSPVSEYMSPELAKNNPGFELWKHSRKTNPFLFDKNTGERMVKKVENELSKGRAVISHPNGRLENLAHEEAHNEMRKSKNPIIRGIHILSEKQRKRGNNGRIVALDERLTNKRALKILKEEGIKKEDLEKTKQSFELSNFSYKVEPKINRLENTGSILEEIANKLDNRNPKNQYMILRQKKVQ